MKKQLTGTLIFCLALMVSAVQCQLISSITSPNGRSSQPSQTSTQNRNNNNARQPTLGNNQNQNNNPNIPNNNQNNNQNNNNNPNNDQGFDPAFFDLTGIWESYDQTSAGPVSTELILEQTGTFSQTVTWGDLMTLETGTYVVGDGFIHFVVENHQPQSYQGQPMSWVDSFTYFFTPVDADTMGLEDHVAGTQWTVYRQ